MENYNSPPQISGPKGDVGESNMSLTKEAHDLKVSIANYTQRAETKRLTIKLIALLAAAVLVALGWMFRWQAIELHPAGDRSTTAYLVNRWTGEIRLLYGPVWIVVDEKK